jgi:hypothetical protein
MSFGDMAGELQRASGEGRFFALRKTQLLPHEVFQQKFGVFILSGSYIDPEDYELSLGTSSDGYNFDTVNHFVVVNMGTRVVFGYPNTVVLQDADIWMCLKAGTFVYSRTPLAGVQCSFQHKAAAGPPKSTFGGTLVVQASSCVSTAIPAAFSCLSGRVGALVPLPAELAARNCWRGEMRVPVSPIDHPPFGCEQVHPTSPCI